MRVRSYLMSWGLDQHDLQLSVRSVVMIIMFSMTKRICKLEKACKSFPVMHITYVLYKVSDQQVKLYLITIFYTCNQHLCMSTSTLVTEHTHQDNTTQEGLA